MKNLIIILFVLTIIACKSLSGRIGLHGMVIYGQKGSYFLDHIPMEHAPHDLQVLTQVKLFSRNGTLLSLDLSNETFTFKPKTIFSLDDFAGGKITTFVGDLYVGGFEQGGRIHLSSVTVKVSSVEVHRQIPSDAELESYQFEEFKLNVITPERNFQSVVNTKTGKVIWCVKGPEFFEPCD